VTPEADETGRRLRAASEHLDPEFLLMYCDNYWPLPLERLWRSYKSSGAAMQIAVYDNSDGYTRDNVRVEDGFVAVYDKSRTAPDLEGVDIGFAILQRDLLDRLPDGNPSFEAALYPELVARRQLAAFVTGHRYYSIGSHARLPLTEAFFARRPAVILDRDGVLNERMPRAEYVRRWADWRWKDGAIEALRRFAAAGWRVIVVTNQAGIARGAMTETDLAAIHERMCAEAAAAGGRIDAIYHCPHGWDEGCACRKPAPGMLFQAQRAFDLDLSRVCFVGDDERDGQAAEAAGCRFVPAADDVPLSRIADRMINE
jgi:D-glycero-D-manno-heptose 1,7-bisphosphate phosphatase